MMTSSQLVLLAAIEGAAADGGIRVVLEGDGPTFLVLRLTNCVAVGISGLDPRRAAELVDRLRCSVARTDVLVAQHLSDVMAAVDTLTPRRAS